MLDDTLIKVVYSIQRDQLIYVEELEVFPDLILDGFDTSFSTCLHELSWSLANSVQGLQNGPQLLRINGALRIANVVMVGRADRTLAVFGHSDEALL